MRRKTRQDIRGNCEARQMSEVTKKMTYANAYATFCKLFYFCHDFVIFSGISSTISPFLHPNSTCLLGCRISFPALKSKRVNSLAGKKVFESVSFLTLIEANVFDPFSSIFNRQRCRHLAGTLRVEIYEYTSGCLHTSG